MSNTAQAVDIEPILREVFRDAKAFSADKHQKISFKFEAAKPCMFLGDTRQLYSAFSNIAFNAVKYTPAQGDIELCWWQDDSGAHFSVSDSGEGFDTMHIPHLTERFYRTDPSRDNASGGSGLGLAIVKHVLLNHNAELEIHSEEGVGSEFICHFPKSAVIEQESNTGKHHSEANA